MASHVWDKVANAADSLAQSARDAYRSVFTAAAWADPRADIAFSLRSFEQQLQWYLDAGIGAVDGLLESVNPLSSLFEIPDFGPLYGNADAYAQGATVGTVIGIGVSSAGGFGALGLGQRTLTPTFPSTYGDVLIIFARPHCGRVTKLHTFAAGLSCKRTHCVQKSLVLLGFSSEA